MTSEPHVTADELRRIIGEGRISENALRAITGIPGERLAPFLNESRLGASGLSATPSALLPHEGSRLSLLAAQLTEGFRIDDDERVTAIIETLTAQFQLTHANIARLIRVGLDDLEGFVGDPASVPSEKKYELAVRASYLMLAVANARPDSARSS